MSKIDPTLFSAHAHALEREYHQCPECGAELVVRHGKSGPFLGCSGYPTCQYIRSLSQPSVAIEKVLTGSSCPACGHELAIKKGRYGLFIGCTHFPTCLHIESQDDMAAMPLEVPCPSCGGGDLVGRTSRHGKLFYACDAFPRCKYVVNEPPVARPCPECGWGILVEKSTRQGKKLSCPQKLCHYQTDI